MKRSLIDCEIIFLAGVHAVGKTYFCNLLHSHFKFSSYSASSLIKHNSLSKEVENVQNNQDALCHALTKEATSDRLIILDGHFCIQNKKKEIEHIPISVFEIISPRAIILLKLCPELISKRRLERDGILISPAFIDSFQTQEIERARFVSEKLSIPLLEINSLENFSVILTRVKDLFND